MQRQRRIALSALAVMLMLAGATAPVSAATIFTDPVFFELVTGGSTLVDDYNDFSSFADLSRVTDRGNYQLRELTGESFGDGGSGFLNLNGTGYLLIDSFSASRFEFQFSNPVTAVGFWYQNDNITTDMELTWGSFSTPVAPSVTPQFLGVIFDAPVLSFDVRTNSNDLIAIDNLRAVAVPEPASASLAMVGISALLMRRRRRERLSERE